jgi:hypothetical protein
VRCAKELNFGLLKKVYWVLSEEHRRIYTNNISVGGITYRFFLPRANNLPAIFFAGILQNNYLA